MYCNVNPYILVEKLQINSFNAGLPGQQLDMSLTVIKEAIKRYGIKHIYLELYYAIANFPEIENRNNYALLWCYKVTRYLPFSFDKITYLLQMSPKEYWIVNFIFARREAGEFYNPDRIGNIIKYKTTEEYWSNDPANWSKPQMPYEGKGYFPIDRTVNDWNYFTDSGDLVIDIDEFSKNWEKNLLEIVDFCEENEIELTVFSAPIPPMP